LVLGTKLFFEKRFYFNPGLTQIIHNMKKLRLLAFASLVAGAAHAQYFQHVYGDASYDYLESGVNLNQFTTGQAHVMTGYTDFSGFNEPMVTMTDKDGKPSPYNFRYTILDNGGVTDAKARRIVELSNNPGFTGVWGDYSLSPGSGAPSTNFFYMSLDPNGNPMFVHSYFLPNGAYEVQATSMCTSANYPNDVFVCGWERKFPGGPRLPVVMRIDQFTGASTWWWQYDSNIQGLDWTPTDIVESPFFDPNWPNYKMLALSGTFTRPGTPDNGCFFRVEEAGGNFVPGMTSYGSFNAKGAFNSIDVAFNSYGGNQGFVMGGYYHNAATGSDDSWAIKVNQDGTALYFSTLCDYKPNGGNDYCNDIIERFSPGLGNYEYYMGGYAEKGVFGNNDDVVYKLDFTGVPQPAGQITFGATGDERILQLDKYDGIGPDNDGLSSFGTTIGSFSSLGKEDFYFVKSYFNGVTACNFDIQTNAWMDGPGITERWNAFNPVKLKDYMLQAFPSPMNEKEICYDAGPIPG